MQIHEVTRLDEQLGGMVSDLAKGAIASSLRRRSPTSAPPENRSSIVDPATGKPFSGAVSASKQTQPAPAAQTPSMTNQQARAAVKQFMSQGISRQQQNAMASFLQQASGVQQVKSTGNPVTDALLNELGIRTR